MPTTFETPVHRPMIIGGAETEARSGERFSRSSPAHDIVVSTYPQAAADDVDRAVSAARRAFDDGPWPRMSGAERSALLQRVAELIRRDAEALARTEALESGKPITQAEGEVQATAGLWDYASTLARHTYGDAHSGLGAEVLGLVLHEPVGVVAMITPWNFPLLIISQKLPFALAVGCTAVIKPSTLTSGTTVHLVGLLREAGTPDGVVNVVTGSGGVGGSLCRHAGVDMISFTGSTEVGRMIARDAGEQLKRVELELGGKNPQIICADADLEAAVNGVVYGALFNQGECCNAGSRLLVQASVADSVTEQIAERAKAVLVGDPLDPNTKVGAIASDEQLATIERMVMLGRQDGARVLTGGERLPTQTGRFFQPTVFASVAPEMSIAHEEIFGPVLSVLTFNELDEAIRIANSTMYGLSAGIWTRDIDTAVRTARAIRAGTIWVNSWLEGYPELPFGGFGSSGIGRELGRQAIAGFTETKTIQVHTSWRAPWPAPAIPTGDR
jgi:betaine-aldehyde dehydrogenase